MFAYPIIILECNHKKRMKTQSRFRIVEKGGITLEQKLRRSNPWSKEKCGRPKCFPCQGGDGGNCWRESVIYIIFCEECGKEVANLAGMATQEASNIGST